MATYRDKLERILQSMQERTGMTNLLPGSKAYQLAESYAYEQMLQEAKQEDWTSSNSISEAKGEKLDAISKGFFKIPRLEAVRSYASSSMKALKFYTDDGYTFGSINTDESSNVTMQQDIIINEGTTISGIRDGLIYKFRVIEDTVLEKSSKEAYVNAELIQGASDNIPANILKIHNFTNYSQSVNGLLKVTNPVPVNSGRPRELDENYRFRLANSMRAFPKTTSVAIHQQVTSMPGVSDVYIETAANGGGTFTVYVQGTTPITSNDLIEDVNLSLSQVINPWQVTYTVTKPRYLGISASLNLVFKDGFNLAASEIAVNSIINYLNNFNGQVFYVNSILSIAQGVHSDILDVSFNYVRLHVGSEDIRSYEEFNLTEDPNPTIVLEVKEKLISEPITSAIIAVPVV